MVFFVLRQCTKTCGLGLQIRSVTCHRVSKEGWTEPTEEQQGCDEATKPISRKTCYPGDCNALFHWQATEWTAVSLQKALRQFVGSVCHSPSFYLFRHFVNFSWDETVTLMNSLC